jgi:hypothetical protein
VGGRRARRALIAAAGAAALVLGLGQVLLPVLARHEISTRIARYGQVGSVSVSAWPAIRLLWGSADAVRVSASELALTPHQSASLLAEARGTGSLDAGVRSLREGPLALRSVRLHKRGALMEGEALIDGGAVAAALPQGLEVTLLDGRGGVVRARVRGTLFGFKGEMVVLARADRGRLVVEALDGPARGLSVVLFSDPRIQVLGVGAAIARVRPLAYRLTMRARLR